MNIHTRRQAKQERKKWEKCRQEKDARRRLDLEVNVVVAMSAAVDAGEALSNHSNSRARTGARGDLRKVHKQAMYIGQTNKKLM